MWKLCKSLSERCKSTGFLKSNSATKTQQHQHPISLFIKEWTTSATGAGTPEYNRTPSAPNRLFLSWNLYGQYWNVNMRQSAIFCLKNNILTARNFTVLLDFSLKLPRKHCNPSTFSLTCVNNNRCESEFKENRFVCVDWGAWWDDWLPLTCWKVRLCLPAGIFLKENMSTAW